MKNWKMKLVTGLITLLLVLLAADVVAVMPAALPFILGAFALPGVWLFARLLYRWLTSEDVPVRVRLPRHRKKGQVDWERLWAGVKEEDKEGGSL